MNSFLYDLAKAHQQHEGWYPGSYAYRNNNPGNIRGPGGAFINFPTYEEGFGALKNDLRAKIFGTAGSVQRYMKGSGKTYEELVFQDYVSIYAPSADHNNPVNYCNALCQTLSKYLLTPSTPLFIMAQLVREEIDSVAYPPAPKMSPEQRLATAENALRFANADRRNLLLRLIDRLKKLLS